LLERNSILDDYKVCIGSQFFDLNPEEQDYINISLEKILSNGENYSGDDIYCTIFDSSNNGFNFRLSDFVNALKSSATPCLLAGPNNDELDCVFYDKNSGTVKVAPKALRAFDRELIFNEDLPRLHDYLQTQKGRRKVLRNSETSDNHGVKPLIVKREDVFEKDSYIFFDAPDFIPFDEIGYYSLLFFNNSGDLVKIDLNGYKGSAISTRSGFYGLVNEGGRDAGYCLNTSEFLLKLGAYNILKESPYDLSFYKRNLSGTIYQPVFEKIRLKIPRFLGGGLSGEGKVNEFASALEVTFKNEDVLITDGRHPCEIIRSSINGRPTSLTNPKFYKMALEHAGRLNIKVSYDAERFDVTG
jgi:hypothetical protein